MPVLEFHTFMSLPNKLELLILPFKAFMVSSWCFCLSVMASSCLLKAAFVVFFHPQLHFSYHIMMRLDQLGLNTLIALVGKAVYSTK